MNVIRLGNIAIFVGGLSIATVFFAYVIAVNYGHVPLCMPLLEGCTSISSTGRASPESLFFRATMIPVAMLMILYWYLMAQWLTRISGRKRRQFHIIFILGLVSAVFLIVYTVALGFIDPVYALQRRVGVTLFFSGALIAQLMVSNIIFKLVRARHLQLPYHLHYLLLGISVVMVLIGLSSIPASIYFSHIHVMDNIIEWNYALFMNLFYIVTGVIWRLTDFRLDFHVRS